MICRECRAVVKYGWRHGRPGWWHREDLDHDAFPIVAPTEEEPEPIPPIEKPCYKMTIDDFAPRSGIRQIINLVNKTACWELRRLTGARGPYMGGSGKVLSISDTVVLGARGDTLDGEARIAVGSWRDGKFDFAYIGIIQDGRLITHRVKSTGLKNWIKGVGSLESIAEEEAACSESE